MHCRHSWLIGIGLVAITASLVMSQSPTPSIGNGSGITGSIFISPARPGPIHPGDSTRAPAGNVEFTVKSGETAVATFRTDAEGFFRVPLPPGHYTVMRETGRIGRWHFEADVAAGQWTKVSWTADSGMR
jgi:hypothetical protein